MDDDKLIIEFIKRQFRGWISNLAANISEDTGPVDPRLFYLALTAVATEYDIEAETEDLDYDEFLKGLDDGQ